jgi:hypothetical protein
MTLASLSHAAIVYDQSPTADGLATTSAPASIFDRAADDFSLSSATSVAGVIFWGRQATGSSFELTIYNDLAGLPGSAVGSESISVSSMLVSDSGLNDQSANDIYEYRADFVNPISLSGSTPYWFGVRYEGGDWRWYESVSTGTHALQSGSGWASFPGDMAFQLSDSAVVPEPGSIAVLSFAAVGLAFGAWRRRKKQKPASD